MTLTNDFNYALGHRGGEDGEEGVGDGWDPGCGGGVHPEAVQLQHEHPQRLERPLDQAVDQHRGQQHLVGGQVGQAPPGHLQCLDLSSFPTSSSQLN